MTHGKLAFATLSVALSLVQGLSEARELPLAAPALVDDFLFHERGGLSGLE